MNLRELWQRLIDVHQPDIETDERIRDRVARTLDAEAALQRAIADEAHARGRRDSAADRRRLAESLEAEAVLIRLADEYDVISCDTPRKPDREPNGESQ